jgi:hypothetical protein
MKHWSPRTPKSAGVVVCPAAEPYVLGGGYSLDPPVENNLSLFSVTSSNPYVPASLPYGWRVTGQSPSPNPPDLVTIYAMCAK